MRPKRISIFENVLAIMHLIKSINYLFMERKNRFSFYSIVNMGKIEEWRLFCVGPRNKIQNVLYCQETIGFVYLPVKLRFTFNKINITQYLAWMKMRGRRASTMCEHKNPTKHNIWCVAPTAAPTEKKIHFEHKNYLVQHKLMAPKWERKVFILVQNYPDQLDVAIAMGIFRNKFKWVRKNEDTSSKPSLGYEKLLNPISAMFLRVLNFLLSSYLFIIIIYNVCVSVSVSPSMRHITFSFCLSFMSCVCVFKCSSIHNPQAILKYVSLFFLVMCQCRGLVTMDFIFYHLFMIIIHAHTIF